jgi:hypothetical protein
LLESKLERSLPKTKIQIEGVSWCTLMKKGVYLCFEINIYKATEKKRVKGVVPASDPDLLLPLKVAAQWSSKCNWPPSVTIAITCPSLVVLVPICVIASGFATVASTWIIIIQLRQFCFFFILSCHPFSTHRSKLRLLCFFLFRLLVLSLLLSYCFLGTLPLLPFSFSTLLFRLSRLFLSPSSTALGLAAQIFRLLAAARVRRTAACAAARA